MAETVVEIDPVEPKDMSMSHAACMARKVQEGMEVAAIIEGLMEARIKRAEADAAEAKAELAAMQGLHVLINECCEGVGLPIPMPRGGSK